MKQGSLPQVSAHSQPQLLHPASCRRFSGPSRPAQQTSRGLKAVQAPDYEQIEEKTYLDERFWLERPAGPRTGFDRSKLDRADTAPAAELEDMNHFAMEVFDSQLIADFYVKVLGFKQVNRPRFPFDGAWLRGAGVFIHLILADPTVPRKSDNWKASMPTPFSQKWTWTRELTVGMHAFAIVAYRMVHCYMKDCKAAVVHVARWYHSA